MGSAISWMLEKGGAKSHIIIFQTAIIVSYRGITGLKKEWDYLIEPLISCRSASEAESSARFACICSAAWTARRLSTSFSQAAHTVAKLVGCFIFGARSRVG
jgi:hypothetical protein